MQLAMKRPLEEPHSRGIASFISAEVWENITELLIKQGIIIGQWNTL